MRTQNNYTSCLALTVRKEHRLMVVNKVVFSSIRVSTKAIFAAIILSLVNMFM